MIQKQEFYHGAALIRLLNDHRCLSLCRCDLGYSVNGQNLIYFKYSTKAHSPWGFAFSAEEIEKLNHLKIQYKKIVLVLVCDGDGICALTLETANNLLGNNAGSISAKRNFRGQYSISGSMADLGHKIAHNEWPAILFE